jgi:hypothetical protein
MNDATDSPDEALVQEVADVLRMTTSDSTLPEELQRDARAVLAHLADRLIPADAEEREEWGVTWERPNGEAGDYEYETEIEARTMARQVILARDSQPNIGIGAPTISRRTVRTWEKADGSTGMVGGPWVEAAG